MNREIKFRHYFPSTKVMSAGHHPHTLILTSDGKEEYWKEVIWMQYTGLKDKNGKEIYEGDILKDSDGGECSHHKIYWDEDGGRWNDLRLEDGDSATGYYEFEFVKDCKVIGNIHENPELLTH